MLEFGHEQREPTYQATGSQRHFAAHNSSLRPAGVLGFEKVNDENKIMTTDKIICKKCGAKVHPLAVFPGGICLKCHEVKFDAEVRRNGGVLPRPDFVKAVLLR